MLRVSTGVGGWCESKQDTSLCVLPLGTPSIIVIQARNEKLRRQGSVSLKSKEAKKKKGKNRKDGLS